MPYTVEEHAAACGCDIVQFIGAIGTYEGRSDAEVSTAQKAYKGLLKEPLGTLPKWVLDWVAVNEVSVTRRRLRSAHPTLLHIPIRGLSAVTAHAA